MKLWLKLLSLVFWGALSLENLYAQDFAIPYICRDRAQAESILLNVPQNQIKNALADPNQGKTYDYAKLRKNLAATLNDLNQELSAGSGDLFSYLAGCASNPALCVGHFNPKNEFHLRLFCDKEMLRTAIEGTLTYQNTWIARCGLSPESFYRSPLENNPEYLRDCFQDQTDAHGQIHRTPVVQKYNTEQAWLSSWTAKFYEEISGAIQASKYPDAMAYILSKVSEEFGLRGSAQKEAFDQQLRYAAFIRALTAPSERFESYQGKFFIADRYINTVAQTLIQQDGRLGLVFQPQRTETIRALKEFEIFRTMYGDPRKQVATLEAAPKTLRYSDFQSPKTPSTESQQKNILKGFLPYQFMRVAKAKVIRTLQQHTKSRFEFLMRDKDAAGKTIDPVFLSWADDQVVCLSNTTRFCSKELREFRYKYYRLWFGQIQNGSIELDFDPSTLDSSWRTYIYDQKFIDELNRRLSEINRFCWENAIPPSEYGKNSVRLSLLEQKAPALESMIEQLFQTPRYSELLENPFFNRLTQYKAGESKYSACFSDGYIFGSEPRKTQEFYSHVDHYAPYPGIRVDNSVGMETVIRAHEKYAEPKIQLTKAQIEQVENNLTTLINAEFNKVYGADRLSDADDIADFLEKSASERIFALLEYGIDHPSQTVGSLIRSMLEKSNHDDISWQRTQQNLMIFVVAASIATAFVIPSSMLVIYKLGAAVVSFTAGAALGLSAEFYYQKDLNALGRAAISDNLLSTDAFELQGILLEKIESNRLTTAFFSTLAIATDLVIVVRGIRLLRQFLDKEMRQIYFRRMLELDKLQRTLTEIDEVTGRVRPVQWMTYEFKSFLANAGRVSKTLYDDFIRAATRGEGPEFAMRTTGLAERFPGLRPVSRNLITTIFKPLTWTIQQLSRPFMAGLDFLFRNIRFLQRIKAWWIQNLYRLARRDFLNQYKFIDTVNYALEKGHINIQDIERRLADMPGYEIRNGRLFWAVSQVRLLQADIFIDSLLTHHLNRLLATGRVQMRELEALQSNLPGFAVIDGKVSWVLGESNLANLLVNPIFKNHGLTDIVEYLNPVIKGNILDDATWTRLFNQMKTPLETISDCKSFLKGVKFIAQEYGFREQIRRLANGNGISYQKILDFLVDNFDDVLETSKFVQYKNMVRFGEYISELVRTNPNYTIPEIHQAIRNIHTYDLNDIVTHLDRYRGLRDAYKSSSRVSPEGLRMNVLQSELIKQEEDISALFYDRLGKELRKLNNGKDFAYAYDRALFRAQQRKILDMECRLPNSAIRTAPDRLFKNFAQYVSTITNVYGYVSNHPPSEEGFDLEFMTRLGYEIMIPILSQTLKTEGFIRAKTISGKALTDWGSGMAVGATVVPLYQTFDALFWDSPDLYTAKIRELIYSADNPQEKLNALYKKYPQIQAQIEAKIEKMKKVWIDYFETLTDEDLATPEAQAQFANGLYEEFLKNQLFEEFKGEIDKADGDTLIRDTLEEVFYHNAFDSKNSAIHWGLFGYEIGKITPPPLPKVMEIRSRDWMLVPDFMAESFDRFAFYAGYDLVIDSPLTIVRQQAIRKTLCSLRHFPPIVGVGSAALMYATYKILYDPFRYWVRKQMIGH